MQQEIANHELPILAGMAAIAIAKAGLFFTLTYTFRYDALLCAYNLQNFSQLMDLSCPKMMDVL